MSRLVRPLAVRTSPRRRLPLRTGKGSPLPRCEATTAHRQEPETAPGPSQPTAAGDPPLRRLEPPSLFRARSLRLMAFRQQEIPVAAWGTAMYTATTISATIPSWASSSATWCTPPTAACGPDWASAPRLGIRLRGTAWSAGPKPLGSRAWHRPWWPASRARSPKTVISAVGLARHIGDSLCHTALQCAL